MEKDLDRNFTEDLQISEINIKVFKLIYLSGKWKGEMPYQSLHIGP